MPNLTLAINIDGSLPEKQILDENYIIQNMGKAFILDGIQRLSTMKRIVDNEKFPHDRVLYCNILVCNSMDRLLYRMITLNNGQKPIDIRPRTRYNISNLIRKQCYHYRIQSENGSHKYEFAGTEWLNPQGDSVTHLSARGA